MKRYLISLICLFATTASASLFADNSTSITISDVTANSAKASYTMDPCYFETSMMYKEYGSTDWLALAQYTKPAPAKYTMSRLKPDTYYDVGVCCESGPNGPVPRCYPWAEHTFKTEKAAQ